jgi:hypothetical protein
MSDDSTLAIVALEQLRQADRAYGYPKNWVQRRRLAVVAQCCPNRAPLLEVMETEPPCVVVRGVKYGKAADDRKPWQGAGRGAESFGWLSTFEGMAGTNINYWLWCEHRRWYVSAAGAPSAVVDGAIWIPLDLAGIERFAGHMRAHSNTHYF